MAVRISTIRYQLDDAASAGIARVASATRAVSSGSQQAARSLNQLGQSSEHASRQMRTLDAAASGFAGGLAAGVIGRVLDLVTRLPAGVINATRAQEDFLTSATAMLHSQEQAMALNAALVQQAAKTPFQLSQLRAGTQLLLAYKFQAAEIPGVFELIGDTVARFGSLSTEKITELTTAIGRIKGGGPVGEALETLRRFGITQEDLAAQGVRFAKSGEVLSDKMTTLNAVFSLLRQNQGQMALQSTTLTGRWSTLLDTLSETQRLIGGELLEGMKDFVVQATKSLESLNAFLSAGGAKALIELVGPLVRVAALFVGLSVAIGAARMAMVLFTRSNLILLILSVLLEKILSNQRAMAMLGKLWTDLVNLAKRVWDALGPIVSLLKAIIANLPPPIRLFLEENGVGALLIGILASLAGINALKLIALTITLTATGVQAMLAAILAPLASIAAIAGAPITITILITVAALATLAAVAAHLADIQNRQNLQVEITLIVEVAKVALANFVSLLGQVVNKAVTITASFAGLDASGITQFLRNVQAALTPVTVPVQLGTPAGTVAEPSAAGDAAGTAVTGQAPAEVPAAAPVPSPAAVPAAVPAPAEVPAAAPTPVEVPAPSVQAAPVAGPTAATGPEPSFGGAGGESAPPVILPVEVPAATPNPLAGGVGLDGGVAIGAGLLVGGALLAGIGAGLAAIAGGGDQGGCFVAGTAVATPDRGPQAIETLRPGDAVYAWDFAQRRLVATTITETFEHEDCAVIRLLLVDATVLDVTAEHLLYVGGSWRPAVDVGVGDSLSRPTESGHLVPVGILDRTPIVQRQKVYNLHVAHPDHNFLAGPGLLVHNFKSAFASGAIITRPTRAVLGEGGEPEGVFPLSRAREFGFGGSGGPGGGPVQGGLTINVHLSGGVYATREALTHLAEEIQEITLRRYRLTSSLTYTRS